MADKKFYVVWVGLKPGIYNSWDECKSMVEGYPGAKYKGFKMLAEAQAAFNSGVPEKKDFIKPSVKPIPNGATTAPILNSLSVDAACSGNPGIMEYQGVHVETREVWFHQKFELGTNNVGEFLALVHGLAELKKRNLSIPIYTDSNTALAWLRQKSCKTKLTESESTTRLFELIDRAERWLMNNTYPNSVLKWDTDRWGEIPADFGRK
jgi:ribonuclease HI